MRGSRYHPCPWAELPGSIPAHAGEPPIRYGCRDAEVVYPRACGGAPLVASCRASSWGLSPRMRGSLSSGSRTGLRMGSIPAHAGEPGPPDRPSGLGRVYPRACGGAGSGKTAACGSAGLSPRMRGSRPRPASPPPARGSIPAHAGEPLVLRCPPRIPAVYPRACGGAMLGRCRVEWYSGLSPRMRGSPVDVLLDFVDPGSIPAHAGEPHTTRVPCFLYAVYPRACGGAIYFDAEPEAIQGLSPRMRGSRGQEG